MEGRKIYQISPKTFFPNCINKFLFADFTLRVHTEETVQM